MSLEQRLILFWIFIVFFSLIGIAALLTIVGIVKTEPSFRKWAVAGFAAGVAGVVFIWAKAEQPLDFHVILRAPQGLEAQAFELVSGRYEYAADAGKPASSSGPLELTLGQELGSWEAKFPSRGISSAVKLTLEDNTGQFWKAGPFYPNYNLKSLTPTQAPPDSTGMLVPTLLPSISALADEGDIKFNNFARIIGKRHGKTFYEWRVFVDEPDDVLERIAEVQYLLHPSFPDPLQVRTNPNRKFAVEASGWGQFPIEITVRYKNQSTATMSYSLDFSKEWP
jgi:hypothetical protein